MKVTKLGHSCLLVEMPEPTNRTVLFDPGVMSSIDIGSLEYLDDIVITHAHGDHFSKQTVSDLVEKFSEVRILAPEEVVATLNRQGITASATPPEGIELFEAPHEDVMPLFPHPDNIGVHYLNYLTFPGDSHSFTESKAVLALPITAPWGSTVHAIHLAEKLKPRYVLPIHDWHWSDDATTAMYDDIEQALAKHDIIFCKLENGKPVVLDI